MFYSQSAGETLNKLGVNAEFGLSSEKVRKIREKTGENVLTERKREGFYKRLFSALKEPMILILIFAFILTLGVNLGKQLKTGDGDFSECVGVFLAIALSTTITLVMERSSKKAFSALNRIYKDLEVKVVRDGKIKTVSQRELVVGDIVILETGDKVPTDCRLLDGASLSADESALTGESKPVKKRGDAVLSTSTPLAERINCIYSGTFVTSGSGRAVVTATGDRTEIGRIAGEISGGKDVASPLSKKLANLGKTVTLIGVITAVFVFVISAIRLYRNGTLNFSSVQELFISAIVLIVAAVPEGLPTIVAVSLALNMIKLSKENALIKKMTATETAGAVTVILSDKTGTLTQNEMAVESVCAGATCVKATDNIDKHLLNNFALNTTAEFCGGKWIGSGTEIALLKVFRSKTNEDPSVQRNRYALIFREDFSSDKKYMATTVSLSGRNITYLKGAPEKVLPKCNLTESQKQNVFYAIEKKELEAKRVLAFAHKEEDGGFVFDGFVSLSDPVRKDALKAIADCKRAGIKVKILTGDNRMTALAVARELGIADSESMVVNASDIENMDEKTLFKALSKITVIARSTPSVKLKVVRTLKNAGEIVAVTGDGINDAPAIRHADVGIAMGKTGSEITKEAADCILLDDAFSTVVKAVSFGRNFYVNLKRFVLFQLSVNLSALLYITVCSVLGLPSLFNTLQLLWINVIMDGPPALTLGLEPPSPSLLKQKPPKKGESVLTPKLALRIAFNGVLVATVLILESVYNFIGAKESERSGVLFTLFILFQLFNAFNCRELGAESVFKRITKNKIMGITFLLLLIVHALTVTVFPGVFGIGAIRFSVLLRCALVSMSIVLFSEAYKFVYRQVRGKGKNKIRVTVNKNRFQSID